MSIFTIVKRYTGEDLESNLSCGGNIGFLDLKPGEKILDLGCGRGSETLQAAKLVGEQGFAWGLDVTPKMVGLARENAVAAGIENARFLLASMEQLPFPNQSFDAVMSNCAINHVENKLQVYKEIYRVLKPGGRFVVSDIMTETSLPLEIKNDPEAVAACFGGAITVEEYEEALIEAGFPAIEVYKERRYIKFGYDMISRTFQGVRM